MRILVLLLLLVGCSKVETDGPDAQGYKWVKDGQVGKPIIHRNADVFLSCMFEDKAQSCAIIAEGLCNVYLPPNPAPWMEAHELRHCAGWRHPDWTRGA